MANILMRTIQVDVLVGLISARKEEVSGGGAYMFPLLHSSENTLQLLLCCFPCAYLGNGMTSCYVTVELRYTALPEFHLKLPEEHVIIFAALLAVAAVYYSDKERIPTRSVL